MDLKNIIYDYFNQGKTLIEVYSTLKQSGLNIPYIEVKKIYMELLLQSKRGK